ncbi:benzoate 12-dioxygenase alpha subunit protein [Candidatus Micropelagos thuwalensis]|uniref:Dihydrolipoyllysine-residue succinyltransferase component of 2-oxoglutarate dehydrogenase complex n=1 Tax=Candidatus Micropelagius thuwalensis TaxID=1397666 RepID=U2XMU6_9PROT|nr:2-oxoglutarate dehydrogenase complex dihydrolipoyllysine-residue succinyltransferase [Candidatus Micropelagos thuwalensis]ERL46447.1 benzoate 12-dioxygenase alpha subunit protein [Candidatus Micropelagos thuwalensis]
MSTEIRVPTLGESITEATVAQWYKKPGEAVSADEPLCELETDKVTIEVPAPSAGVMGDVAVEDGATVEVGALLGEILEGTGAGAIASSPSNDAPVSAPSEPRATDTSEAPKQEPAVKSATEEGVLAPSVRRLVDEHGLDAAALSGSGKGGRLTKGDVLEAVEKGVTTSAEIPAPLVSARSDDSSGLPQLEERVKMTRLRQTIAKRLKESQNTAAMLTTFNEVDMSELMSVRSAYKEQFEKKHGAKLGFMSFFVKACVVALQEIPAVNAEIDGTDIVYKHYVNMGVAVGTDKGLVVPVVRNAHLMGFAEIETTIAEYGQKAREGSLAIDDLQGGTFTISNGGVYGSLMSTPILNSPQSGILGMHKIQERPIVVDGEIVVRPMMYLALSYDHRIVDGKEAVTFLVRVKEGLENPERLLLNL